MVQPIVFKKSKMLMLRGLIISWLILSILGTGMAVAIDFHDESLPEQAQLLNDHSGLSDQSESDALHDHCSHASFHLLGLNSVPTNLGFYGSHNPEDRYKFVWNSYQAPPPSQPPKA